MKKFLLFALCAISAVSVFAEPFSQKKCASKTIWDEKLLYSYESEVSSESNYNHLTFALRYLQKKTNRYLTVEEINDYAKKFKGKVKDNEFKLAIASNMAYNLHIDDALKYSQGIQPIWLKQAIFDAYIKAKNKEEAWKYGKNILINNGQGQTNDVIVNKILTNMFRYKPASVTKEQQIEFLKQVAQIYPIPGTDFNKWKSFMGFVGFKYKQLTGKELF